MYLKFFTENCS